MIKLKSFVATTAFLVLSQYTSTAIANDASPAMTPINNMFDAMREHDGEKLLAQFVEGAMLERAHKDNSIKQTELAKFAAFVSQTDKHLDEHLFNVTIKTSDNLASAWTPYAFYLDGKLSHCGVNSFQMIKQNNQWKIRYLIDNQHLGDCTTFIENHKKTSN
ncbi:hypothetical protein [Thalassotalea marina]|uniref:Nuclear transport factor 2 family protein n=1 Tax=Thalassotalea marina TaxID=1673741 RepID=A0A919BRW8_9GAMM|nr:hypothetical protein [Thalassotalea marina]GHG08270.1 hypothetical protein GCM10017161_42570 [Thalassotalea marina]